MEKRAVVIGIDYAGTNRSLGGCINDADRIASMLRRNGYMVLLMTNELEPNYQNILESFEWLLHSCNKQAFGKSKKYPLISSGTRLYFHFSGHGTQIVDKKSDEPGRLSQAIIASDGENVPDDVVYEHLISEIPAGVQLRGSIDCCGRSNFYLRWNLIRFNGSYTLKKSGSGRNSYCDAIIVSGASGNRASGSGGSNEKSYDTTINGIKTGVLTHYYLEIMENHNYSIPTDKLLDYLQNKIKHNGYRQTPGICFGKQIPITTTFSL